jgi:signal transduction histidine kinase
LKSKVKAQEYHTPFILREQAESILDKVRNSSDSSTVNDIDVVLQELQVHQIELEMQNDELLIANEEIEIQRLRFENIYNLAPVGYFILDNHGIIEDVNAAGLKLLETGKSIIRCKSLYSYISADNADKFYQFYRHLLSSPDKQSCQLKLVSKTGREFYALLEGRSVPISAQCYIAIIDVSEGIAARQHLVETNDRLELALEASAAGTWELHFPAMHFYLDDMTNRICNAGVGKFDSTYPAFINLVHPDDRFMIDQHFRTAINQDKEIDIVSRFINTKGQVCFASIRGHLAHIDTEVQKRFVGIMWDITEKKLLEEKADEQKLTRQKEITTATLNAEQNERRRISEALHDSVSQLLYGIKMQVGQLGNGDKAAATVKLNQLLDMAIKETRNISFELAPSTLADFGLPATITELCERLSTPQMKITAIVSGFGQRSDLLQESTIFRIIQELINNCMKHSGASHVRIQIKKSKKIEIVVSDNGNGFAIAEQVNNLGGSGIYSIKNRLSLYNGTFDIDSSAGRGTTVKISLESLCG